MSIVPDLQRRPGAGDRPVVTTRRRQSLRADPDLARLDERIAALKGAAAERGRTTEVDRLRLRYDHLDRDKAQQTFLWLNELRNLRLAVDREERYGLAGTEAYRV